MVLVGKREYKYRGMKMSHMVSDNLEELHTMAMNIGIHQRHFQNKAGMPHYDVSKGYKAVAIKLGAKEVDDREIVKLFKSLT
jgi:hypothetical protein